MAIEILGLETKSIKFYSELKYKTIKEMVLTIEPFYVHGGRIYTKYPAIAEYLREEGYEIREIE